MQQMSAGIHLFRVKTEKLKQDVICDALRDVELFLQFKKREKHPRRSATFSKVAG